MGNGVRDTFQNNIYLFTVLKKKEDMDSETVTVAVSTLTDCLRAKAAPPSLAFSKSVLFFAKL